MNSMPPSGRRVGRPRLNRLQPRTLEACEQISELAHQLGSGSRLPKVVDLCEKFGLSLWTLNRALEELERREVISRIQGSGIYVKPGVCRRICVLLSAEYLQQPGHSPFWDTLVDATRDRTRLKGEVFLFHLMGPRKDGDPAIHAALERDIQEGAISGVLAIGVDARMMSRLEQQNVPVVSFAGQSTHNVRINMPELMRLGVGALARLGCRRIALWRPAQVYQREEGLKSPRGIYYNDAFERACVANGVEFDVDLLRCNLELIRRDGSHGRISAQKQGYDTALEVFANANADGPKPDGILISDDCMTDGALSGLRKLGILPRRDITIASHANEDSPVLIGEEDDLVLLEYSAQAVASALFRILEKLMDGERPAPPNEILSPKLRWGTNYLPASTANLPELSSSAAQPL